MNREPLAGQAVFDEEEMKKALAKAGGTYTAAGNFFWLDVMYTTLRGVPFNKRNIKLMVDHQFAKPSVFSAPLEIALTDGKCIEPKGSWRCVTPEEKLHAFVWAIARDIESSETNDKIIKEWVKMSLSVSFKFIVIPTEDCFLFCSSVHISVLMFLEGPLTFCWLLMNLWPRKRCTIGVPTSEKRLPQKQRL